MKIGNDEGIETVVDATRSNPSMVNEEKEAKEGSKVTEPIDVLPTTNFGCFPHLEFKKSWWTDETSVNVNPS